MKMYCVLKSIVLCICMCSIVSCKNNQQTDEIASTAIEEIRLEMKNILNKHKNLRVKKLNKSDNV